LLKAAPLSKSAVSRVVGTLKVEPEAWRTRSLTELDVFGLYLDAIALRVRSAGRVVSLSVLAVVAIRTDGQKQLVALECCGGESFEAWKGLVDDLGARGLAAPVVCVIDGHPGCGRPWAAPGHRPASSGAPCTNSATSRARPRSTPWPRSGRTSIGSSTPRAPPQPMPPTRPSNGNGRGSARAWSAACTRAGRNCSRFSSSPRASERRSERRT
jgi:Transposase, Mutator family